MSETEGDLDFASMKVNDLKRELKARGLSITGNKTELVERLQMSLMSTNETDILAEANELLEGGDDEEVTDTSIIEAEPEKKEEVAVKKKVTIKRDTPLPVVNTPEPKPAAVAEPKAAEPVKPAVVPTKVEEAPKADGTTEKVDETKPKDIKALTDAEKAAIRRERFGGSGGASATDVEAKKLERAQRFGLPVTSSNGSSKIGAPPSVDIDTLKKRAERFGTVTSQTMQKLEVEEKIKKRQERFGEVKNGATPPKKASIEVNKALLAPAVDPKTQEMLKKRAERFGVKP